MRGRGRALDLRKSRRRSRLGRALLAGAAVAAPLAAVALLRRRPEPPSAPRWGRTRRFQGALGEIVFQDLGSGPPVVLLHALGPGEGRESWRAVAETLAGRHRVLVPDLPGWGRSPGPPGRAHGPGVYVSTIDDFLEGVVGEPAVVVAAGLTASYTARVAAQGDRDLPTNVRALGLVCPLGLEEDVPALDASPLGRAALTLPFARELALHWRTRKAALERFLRREVYAAPERVDAALLEHRWRTARQPAARDALAALWRGDLWAGAEDWLPLLASRGVPVWIAFGRAARNPPVERAELWARHLPQAEVDVFEGCGRLPHAEAPALFCAALERFLDKLPAGRERIHPK